MQAYVYEYVLRTYTNYLYTETQHDDPSSEPANEYLHNILNTFTVVCTKHIVYIINSRDTRSVYAMIMIMLCYIIIL